MSVGEPISEAQRQTVLEAYGRTGSITAAARDGGVHWTTAKRWVQVTQPKGGGPPAPDLPPILAELLAEGPRPAIRAAVDAELDRQRMAGASGKPEVIVEAGEPTKLWAPGRTNTVHADRRYERIAFISDLHHPFQDKAALRAVFAALRDYKPQLIIIGGDYFDCFTISDHDREPGRVSCLQDEFDSARDTSRELDDVGRDSTVVFISGNHEERIDRLQRRNPGLFNLRSLELPIAADLPKRWLYYPDQTRYRIGSLTALHGNLKGRGTSMQHAAAGMLRKLRTTCIAGHLHRFQSFMETCDDGTIRAGYANGHLCDVEEARYISSPDWQSGFTTIDFDWSLGIFSVAPHLIVKDAILWNGKVYRG